MSNYPVEVHKTISVEEAARLINDIVVPKAIKAQRLYMDQVWRFGKIVAHVEKPWGERVEIYEKLSELTGIHHTTLRQYEALFDQFHGKEESFNRFLDYYEKQNQLKVNFSNVSRVLKLLDKVEPEFQEEVFVLKVEKAVNEIAKLNEKAQKDKLDQDIALSIQQKFEQEVLALREHEPNKDTAPPRSTTYLDFIREQRCVLSGFCDCSIKSNVTEAHHTSNEGRGIKGSDFSCIPLCPTSHRFWHNEGRENFENHYGVTASELVAEMLHRAATGKPLYFKFDLSK